MTISRVAAIEVPLCADSPPAHCVCQLERPADTLHQCFCQAHTPTVLPPKQAPLEPGQRVQAKWSGSYYPGEVTGLSSSRYCTVRFDDGSVAQELELRYLYPLGTEKPEPKVQDTTAPAT